MCVVYCTYRHLPSPEKRGSPMALPYADKPESQAKERLVPRKQSAAVRPKSRFGRRFAALHRWRFWLAWRAGAGDVHLGTSWDTRCPSAGPRLTWRKDLRRRSSPGDECRRREIRSYVNGARSKAAMSLKNVPANCTSPIARMNRLPEGRFSDAAPRLLNRAANFLRRAATRAVGCAAIGRLCDFSGSLDERGCEDATR